MKEETSEASSCQTFPLSRLTLDCTDETRCKVFANQLQTELSTGLQSLSEKAKGASESVARLKALQEKVNVSLASGALSRGAPCLSVFLSKPTRLALPVNNLSSYLSL